MAVQTDRIEIGRTKTVTTALATAAGAAVTGQTVTYTLRDSAGAVVANAEDVAMPETATAGAYAAELPYSVTAGLAENGDYDLEVHVAGHDTPHSVRRCKAVKYPEA